MDKEPSIMVRQPHATMQLATQDIQLVSKRSVLRFKPQLRFEWRDQGGQDDRVARSFPQLERFRRVINSDKVFGTHSHDLPWMPLKGVYYLSYS